MFVITGAILLESGKPAAAEIVVDGDTISDIRLTHGRPGDVLILPGIVDFHGDAFERHIMPRPNVTFPLDIALRDIDGQLAANGITTAYHAITASFEPGLRSVDQLVSFMRALDEQRPALGIDHRVHMRFETYNLDAVELLRSLIDEGDIDLVAFNDHMPGIRKDLANPAKAGEYAGRSGLSVDAFREMTESLWARGGEVDGALAVIAAAAQARDIPIAAHDNRSADDHARYTALGSTLCEFPITAEAAAIARSAGHDVIMGAPNILRGGSHKAGGMSARDNAIAGTCTILASDYYYPAQLRAAFQLAAADDLGLGAAWRLISENPARALNLTDRGRLAAGLRADMLLVDCAALDAPRLLATFAGGRIVHATHEAGGFCSALDVAA